MRNALITKVISAINLAVFYLAVYFDCLNLLLYSFALVPKEIITGADICETVYLPNVAGKTLFIPLLETPFSIYLTVLTSMFIHGGWVHLIGTLLCLVMVGPTVEKRLGRAYFALFYLFCGIAAVFAETVVKPFSIIPIAGSSGAIYGVVAAYLCLFPGKKIEVQIFGREVSVSISGVFIGWTIAQLLEVCFQSTEKIGGVAVAAHLGGFIAGWLLIKSSLIFRQPSFTN